MAVVNDIIGLIRDGSGNGNNATQTTAASKPKLQQDANGYYYLEFDGVDDNLSLPASTWNPADTHYAAWIDGLPNSGRIVCTSGGAGQVVRAFTPSGEVNLAFSATTDLNNTVTAAVSDGAPYTTGHMIVFCRVSHDGTNTTVTLRLLKEGVDVSNTATGAGVMTAPNGVLIGSYQGTVFSALKLHGCVLRDKEFTEWEQNKIIQLFRAKGAQV